MKVWGRRIFISAVVFMLVLGGVSLCLLPKKAYSESERRRLADMPTLTMESVWDKTYMTELEDFLLDHFPLREGFRRIKAFFSYYCIRQKENNDIYLAKVGADEGGREETVFAGKVEYPLSEASVEQAAEGMKRLQQQYFPEQKVYYAIVPDKNYYLAQQQGVPSLDYDKMAQIMQNRLSDMEYIDIWDTLDIWDYYCTDTHWRQERLEPVVTRIAAAMGIGEDLIWEYEVQEAGSFYGVYYGQSALPMNSESLYYLTSETIEQTRVWNLDTNTTEGVYAVKEVLEEKNSTQSLDKYNLFLHGAQSIQILTNPLAKTDRRLILFRDSFGSSIAPLFLEAYQEIVLIDTRYITTQMLGNYVDFSNSDIFFLYNAILLNQSSAFKK